MDDAERRLWRRMPDPRAREELLQRHMKLARVYAGRYARMSSEPYEDLFQVACVGLVKAINRFDVDLRNEFSTFAIPTIKGELRRYYRDNCWSVHVPRGAQERALDLKKALQHLSNELGRTPTSAELAEHMDVEFEVVLDATQALNGYTTIPFDDPVFSDKPSIDTDTPTLEDQLGVEEPGYEAVDAELYVRWLMRFIPSHHRRMVLLRMHELTQEQIASLIGCSQMHVSRKLRACAKRLEPALDL